jgi:hypothetical protein
MLTHFLDAPQPEPYSTTVKIFQVSAVTVNTVALPIQRNMFRAASLLL